MSYVDAKSASPTVAEIGDIVYWYTDGDPDTTPKPAIVTYVGQHCLTLNIMGPDLKNFQVVDGVHHISDPYCRKIETRESGGWGHTPKTLAAMGVDDEQVS